MELPVSTALSGRMSLPYQAVPWRQQAGDDFVRVGRLATGHLTTVAGEVAVVGALDLAKRVLGNQRYEQLRGLALRVLGR